MIAEPPDTYGLWSRVKALSEWPDTDETKVAGLAHEYDAMARTYDQAATVDIRSAARGWTDEPGTLFAARASAAIAGAGRTAGELRGLGVEAATFAEVVATTKNAIVARIEQGIAFYGTTAALPAGAAEATRNALVTQLAAEVNAMIANAANPGQATAGTEYDRMQQFIFDEMVRNSNSAAVDALKFNNAIPTNKPLAYALWAAMVAPGADWDHKGDMLAMTEGTNTFTPLPGGNGNIRYDMWSNIHYGYVGSEAGFTGFELHAGADAADFVTQRGTDPADQVAVQIGIELREQYPPDQLRPEHVNQAIERHRAELEQHGAIGPRLR